MKRITWNEKHDKILIECSKTHTAKELSIITGFTLASVYKHSSILGIKIESTSYRNNILIDAVRIWHDEISNCAFISKWLNIPKSTIQNWVNYETRE